jgi:hypothetical protein
VDGYLSEMHHSRFLAWLLDPSETHAQGTLFFRMFLMRVGLPENYADTEYDVRREQQGEESRIDIAVACRTRGARGFIVYIENKTGARVGPKQIEREARDLLSEARAKEIPRERVHGFLLTPEPERPRSKLFRRIGWDAVERSLEEFINQAEAPRARFAAEQYLWYIGRYLLGTTDKTEDVVHAKANTR